MLFYKKTTVKVNIQKDFMKEFYDMKEDKCKILPPTMLHIGDNCFSNVIFQSLAFLDFEEETKHYIKSSDSWNVGKKFFQIKKQF